MIQDLNQKSPFRFPSVKIGEPWPGVGDRSFYPLKKILTLPTSSQLPDPSGPKSTGLPIPSKAPVVLFDGNKMTG